MRITSTVCCHLILFMTLSATAISQTSTVITNRPNLAVVAAFEIERDLLVLAQGVEPGPLDGGDVNEHVLGSIVRLDEPEALGVVEEFDCSIHGALQM